MVNSHANESSFAPTRKERLVLRCLGYGARHALLCMHSTALRNAASRMHAATTARTKSATLALHCVECLMLLSPQFWACHAVEVGLRPCRDRWHGWFRDQAARSLVEDSTSPHIDCRSGSGVLGLSPLGETQVLQPSHKVCMQRFMAVLVALVAQVQHEVVVLQGGRLATISTNVGK